MQVGFNSRSQYSGIFNFDNIEKYIRLKILDGEMGSIMSFSFDRFATGFFVVHQLDDPISFFWLLLCTYLSSKNNSMDPFLKALSAHSL
jgi:hypothetical protein